MQFKLSERKREAVRVHVYAVTKMSLLSALVVSGLILGQSDAAFAKAKKKFPKGFVHNTAGDGVSAPVPAAYSKDKTPMWVQYDRGGLYYYNRNEVEKARQYWMAALRLAEQAVPAERQKGLSAKTAEDCCQLIHHLAFFVSDSKFKPKADSSYWGTALTASHPNNSQALANPAQYNLDNTKENLRTMQQDWDWYERICNFADRAIGKQRDCMRQIYNQRSVFERKIVMTRQTAQALEQQLGIDLQHSAIDMRPLKWGGIAGAGNPFDAPNSNSTPIELRGGARPETVGR